MKNNNQIYQTVMNYLCEQKKTYKVKRFRLSNSLKLIVSLILFSAILRATILISSSHGSPTAATAYSFQRKTFYDSSNANHWLFSYNGTEIEYSYTDNSGESWASAGTLPYDTNDFSIWQESINNIEYVFLAVTYDHDIVIRRGILSSSSITWDSGDNVFAFESTGETNSYSGPYISLDSANYIWVAARHYDGENHNFMTTRSDDGHTGDSLWNEMAFGNSISPSQLSLGQNDPNLHSNIVPLENQNMYAVFTSGTAVQGCWWDNTASSWLDSAGDNCSSSRRAVKSHTQGINIQNAISNDSLNQGGKQIIRNSTGELFSFVNNSGSCEIWKSNDNGVQWSEMDASHNPLCDEDSPLSLSLDSTNVINLLFKSSGNLKYTTFNTLTNTFGNSTTIYQASGAISEFELAIDSNDKPHMVGLNNAQQGYEVFYSNLTGNSWKPTEIIANADTASGLSMTINQDDQPVVTYIDTTASELNAIQATVNSPTEEQWIIYTVGSEVADNGTSLVIDSQGNTWIAYSKVVSDNNLITLSRHTYGSAWNDPDNWMERTSSSDGTHPSLAIKDNNMYIFFVNNQNRIIIDRYAENTWDTAAILEQNVNGRMIMSSWSNLNNFDSDGVLDGNAEIDYIYSDGQNLFYNSFVEFNTSSSRDEIDTIVAETSISAVADSTNYDVHLVYVDDEESDQLSYRRWNNGTKSWDSATIKISDSTQPLYPSISMDTSVNNLYVFYVDKTTGNIFYSKCASVNNAANCSDPNYWNSGNDGEIETLWHTGTYSHLSSNYKSSCEAFAYYSTDPEQSTSQWDVISLFSETAMLSQEFFEWFNNDTTTSISDPWPVGDLNIPENAVLNSLPVSYQPLSVGDQIRIQINFQVTSNSCSPNLSAESQRFQLQYSQGEICSTIPENEWIAVGEKDDTDKAFRLFENQTIDGESTESVVQVNQISTSTLTAEGYYSELNPTQTNPNNVAVGQYSEWDWPVENYSANENTSYCFRMVKHDGGTTSTPFENYSFYPRLITQPGTSNLMRGGNYFQGGTEQGFFWTN